MFWSNDKRMPRGIKAIHSSYDDRCEIYHGKIKIGDLIWWSPTTHEVFCNECVTWMARNPGKGRVEILNKMKELKERYLRRKNKNK